MYCVLKYICFVLLVLGCCNGRSAIISENKIFKEPFSFEEFSDGTFNAKSFNATWLSDSTLAYKNDGHIYKFDLKTKTINKILDKSVFEPYDTDYSIYFSKDQLYVLIMYNVQSIFRHSTTAKYTIYHIETGSTYHIHDKKHLQLVKFAPVDHTVVYVFENNIYYLAKPEDVYNPQQLTTKGKPGVVYCGVTDWVYEEEVLATGSALWFSPDAKHLVYATFNDEKVKNYTYFLYGNPGSLEDQYPKQAVIKYPKVGQNNPIVKVNVQDLTSLYSTALELPPEAKEDVNDYVLYDVSWITNEEIAMVSSNRVQNESKLMRCSLNGSCKVEASYNEKNGWVDPALPKYSKDGKQRVEILPQPQGDDRFDHLVLTNIESQSSIRLTKGHRVVNKIYGWDEASGVIYYGGSVNDTPSQQHVYVVSTDGQDKCLTCDFKVFDTTCKYSTASFSKDFTYMAKICTGPSPTYIEIQNIRKDDDVFVWEDNKDLLDKLSKKSMPVIKDLRVPVSDKFEARVRLLLPPDLDEKSSKKYPAIVHVYAGPNSNRIKDQYSAGFENYLVTTREYIYIFIDGRGSGRDGKNKLFEVYRRLGTVEIEDQLTVIEYLQKHLSYVDEKNTGMWGWSYGGFSSVWALAKDNKDVLQFALSVAPVTSFIYYDTIYTERYMGLPTEDDNLAGYNDTDITRNVELLNRKSENYMLIHGNADDNVHYQQAMLLAKALELADLLFTQQSYPDENHSLAHVNKHLYHNIDRFFAQKIEENRRKKQVVFIRN